MSTHDGWRIEAIEPRMADQDRIAEQRSDMEQVVRAMMQGLNVPQEMIDGGKIAWTSRGRQDTGREDVMARAQHDPVIAAFVTAWKTGHFGSWEDALHAMVCCLSDRWRCQEATDRAEINVSEEPPEL